MARFFLNSYARVRLNDLGRKLYRLYFHADPEEEDGWTEMQGWELFAVFGRHIYHGCEPPFDLTIEVDATQGEGSDG